MTNLRKYYQLERVTPQLYDILFLQSHFKGADNGYRIASAVQDANGYFYIQLEEGSGLLNELFFKIGLDVLETLNKPYEEEIKRYFKEK